MNEQVQLKAHKMMGRVVYRSRQPRREGSGQHVIMYNGVNINIRSYARRTPAMQTPILIQRSSCDQKGKKEDHSTVIGKVYHISATN